MYVLELPLCHDAVVVNVVDVDEFINVESAGGPVGNGGEMVMVEGSPG